jgi:hypothetical protein
VHSLNFALYFWMSQLWNVLSKVEYDFSTPEFDLHSQTCWVSIIIGFCPMFHYICVAVCISEGTRVVRIQASLEVNRGLHLKWLHWSLRSMLIEGINISTPIFRPFIISSHKVSPAETQHGTPYFLSIQSSHNTWCWRYDIKRNDHEIWPRSTPLGQVLQIVNDDM